MSGYLLDTSVISLLAPQSSKAKPVSLRLDGFGHGCEAMTKGSSSPR
jgi:hypothetical protein